MRVPLTRQPGPATAIDWSNPLTKGLAYADPGQYGRNLVSGLPSTALTGTKVQTSAGGLVRGFGSTFGTGSTDANVTSLTAHATHRTYWIRVMRNGGGGGNLGRLFDKRTGGAQSELLFYDNSISLLQFGRVHTTTNGQWGAPTNTLPTGAVVCVAVTYDSSSTSNAPLMYANGYPVTVTATSSPSGSPVNNSDAYVLGNRTNDNLRNWDGWIGEFLVWDRILSPAEIAEVSANPWQIFRPIVVPVRAPAGGATHTTTGAVTGAGATVAGSAVHYTKHTSTGAATGAGATVAGSAVHYTKHTTTGAVQGAGATVAGAATHPHTTSGAVTGGGATVAGAADVSTGATHTTTGAVSGAGATVAGAATHLTLHTTTGAAQGAGALVVGAATHLTLHETSGAVQGGGGATTGAAELISLNGGKSSYLRQWLMEYYEAEWAQKAPVLADPPAVAPTPVAQAARTITRRTVRAAVAEQKKPPPAPYRADPRAAVNDFIQKQTAAVARKARVAAAIDSQDLAALTRRQQQRSAEAEEAEDEEILLLAAVL